MIQRVDELLEARYRSTDLGNLDEPLAEAVYIILSAQTREAVYQRVFARLRQEFPRWVDVLTGPRHRITACLRPAGFQRQRTAKLLALLRAVREDNIRRGIAIGSGGQDLTLDHLHDMEDEEAKEFLEGLPGIGPKSARCILAYSLGRESFAADTHVVRILVRLGLIEMPERKPDHDAIEDRVPPAMRKRLHMNLVHHGRAVCRSTKPKCDQCTLVSFCQMGRSHVSFGSAANPTAIELFAGAGGLGLGFSQGGFRVALAVERDGNAAQTYRANHPGTPVLEADVRDVTAGTIKQLCPGLEEPEVLVSGPPCQGFSAAGRRVPNDPINHLYREVVRLARSLRPQMVVIENVPGLRRVNGVGFVDAITSALSSAGYACDSPYDLLASHFGVSQNRRRLVFVGRRRRLGAPPPPPEPTHVPPGEISQNGHDQTPRLEEVLAELPEFSSGVAAERVVEAERVWLNASTMKHSEAVIEKIAGIAPGEGPISYRRLERDVARTLVAGHRALPVHPWLDRTISVREAARIQGFPDDYVFLGPRSEQPLQVANGVPPPVAAAVARRLYTFLTT